MSEEKKPTIAEDLDLLSSTINLAESDRATSPTDFEQERQALARVRDFCERHEARERSRTLSGVSVTVPLYTEEHYKALLEIGFDLALQAVGPQLKTVVSARGTIAWTPPENPFRRESTAVGGKPNPEH